MAGCAGDMYSTVVAEYNENTKLYDSDEVDRFMKAIKQTLLIQLEWQELLPGAPQSLVRMGKCFLAVDRTSNPALKLFDSPGSAPGLT